MIKLKQWQISEKVHDTMKKIPTMFERDWDGDRSRVLNKVHPGCQWVLDGEGIATRKIDGTSCLVREHKLYKRREVRKGQQPPADFDLVEQDDTTGKMIGWQPVGDGPEDKWHREAWDVTGNPERPAGVESGLPNGTYELIGPKVQGNPERALVHLLVSHNATGELLDAPRTFEALQPWLSVRDIEGIVWHHPDGRMAKIKLRDFGLKRKQ